MSTEATGSRSSDEILEREFLELRAKVLELAASFDRLDRGAGEVSGVDQVDRLRRGLQIVLDSRDNRAEQVQLLFSRDYDGKWRDAFQID